MTTDDLKRNDAIGVSPDLRAREPEKPKSKSKPRLGSVDVAKGVAILSIVIGHLANSNAVNFLVFQYHVPIFFVISGYFLSTTRPFEQFVRQKAKRLLTPYLFACASMLAIIIVCRLLAGESNPPTMYGGFKEFLIAAIWGASVSISSPFPIIQIGAIWFLEALFVAIVEVRFCVDFAKGRQWIAPMMVALLFLFAIASKDVLWLPFNIQSGLCAGLWVYVGLEAKRIRLFERPANAFFVIVSAIVVIACWETQAVVYINQAFAGPYGLGIATTLFACYLLIVVSGYLDERGGSFGRILRFYGENSLVILCVHLVAMNCGFGYLFSGIAALGIPHLADLANIIAQIAVATVCVPLFKRTPTVKDIFF